LRFFEIFRSDFRKDFYGVLGLLMQRNGQKRDKKKSMGKDDRKKVFFSQLFQPKVFDMDFPPKVFFGVFELPLLRSSETHKNAIKKISQKKEEKKRGTYRPHLAFSGYLPDIRRFRLPFPLPPPVPSPQFVAP
jgi:hypothetical protein